MVSNSALEKFSWIVEFAIRMFTFIIKSKENYLLQFFFLAEFRRQVTSILPYAFLVGP